MNIIGTLSVLLLPACLLPRFILISIYKRKGKTPIIPVILSCAFISGYLFSGLITLGIIKPIPYTLILLACMIICYFLTIDGYSEVVKKRRLNSQSDLSTKIEINRE